jgi:hypothetical protein
MAQVSPCFLVWFFLCLKSLVKVIAVDYNPVDNVVYWSDQKLNTIYMAYLDRSGESLLSPTPIGNNGGIQFYSCPYVPHLVSAQ